VHQTNPRARPFSAPREPLPPHDSPVRALRRANLNNTRLNEIGATPFLLAALTAHAELMKTLAALGADPRLPNADNTTPLMVAAGLATRSPGEDAGTETEVLEAVEVALDLGADINAVDNNSETAVHDAAYKNLAKVVKLFEAAVRETMIAAGVTPPKTIVAKTQQV
jgi:ankyrin repeat protein